MYGVIAQALGEKPIGVPLDATFDLDMDRMLAIIKKDKPKTGIPQLPQQSHGKLLFSRQDTEGHRSIEGHRRCG